MGFKLVAAIIQILILVIGSGLTFLQYVNSSIDAEVIFSLFATIVLLWISQIVINLKR